MLSKILTMAWKEVYTVYTDRNLMLIMIATPLALVTIIGLAFGGFMGNDGNDVPIRDIPLAIVNLDEGSSGTAGDQNMGQVFVDLLVPGASLDQAQALLDLTEAVTLDDPEAARAQVDAGELAAAVIIPADFTNNILFSPTNTTLSPSTIEVYANAGQPISANIVRSIVTSIGNQIATGNVTIAVTIGNLIERAQNSDLSFSAQLLMNFDPQFDAAFDPASNPIQVEMQTVSGEPARFNPLVYFGAANAILFTLFTARGSANSLLEERKDGTLNRLIVMPTPRLVILLGKLIGTFLTCVVQLLLLFFFLTVIGSMIAGEPQFIWGRDPLAIFGVILAVALAAAGFGSLLTGLVRTAEQGDFIGSTIVLVMGVLSGTFFTVGNIPVLDTLRLFTLNHWGIEAFNKLSLNQTDIGLNLLALVVFGVVSFTFGLFAFNKRLEG
jgi:ABC-2 type transport system permease protein